MQHRLVAGIRRAGALAGIALLAAACGGSPPAGSQASGPPNVAQVLDKYAQCMRTHGEPDTYVTRAPSSPNPGTTVLVFHGFAVDGVNTSSPQFAPAMNACQHLLPHGTPPSAAELHQQFVRGLKAAQCMRSHGYPDWPDPTVHSGYNMQPLPPSGVDTNSPQFQAAAKACRVSLPPG